MRITGKPIATLAHAELSETSLVSGVIGSLTLFEDHPTKAKSNPRQFDMTTFINVDITEFCA